MNRECPFCGRLNDLAGMLRPFCSLDCVDADHATRDHDDERFVALGAMRGAA